MKPSPGNKTEPEEVCDGNFEATAILIFDSFRNLKDR